MCLAPKQQKPPPLPAPPVRASEQVQQGELAAIEAVKRRKGRNAAFLTGGLSDPGFGTAVAAPTLMGA